MKPTRPRDERYPRDAAPPVLGPLLTMNEHELANIDREPPAHLLGWWASAIRQLHTELDAQRAEVARLTAEQARTTAEMNQLEDEVARLESRLEQANVDPSEATTRPTEGAGE